MLGGLKMEGVIIMAKLLFLYKHFSIRAPKVWASCFYYEFKVPDTLVIGEEFSSLP